MDRFNIDDLLRNVFAGAALLGTFLLNHPDITSVVLCPLPAAVVIPVGFGAALFFGSFIYAVHRVFFWFLLWPFLRLIWKSPLTVEEYSLKVYSWRTDEKSPQKNFDRWASQVHFLYCTAWGVLIGYFIVDFMFYRVVQVCLPGPRLHSSWVWAFAGIILFCALLNNWQFLRCVHEWDVRDRQSGRQQPE